VDLDCQLTDPEADVLLIQEVKGSADGIERAPDGVKVTQSGQIFTINNVEKSDEGTYHCKVQSTVLKIEKLYPAAIGSTQGKKWNLWELQCMHIINFAHIVIMRASFQCEVYIDTHHLGSCCVELSSLKLCFRNGIKRATLSSL